MQTQHAAGGTWRAADGVLRDNARMASDEPEFIIVG
jgi:hypothetical protein